MSCQKSIRLIIIVHVLIFILFTTLSYSYHCIRCDGEGCRNLGRNEKSLRAVKCNRTTVVGCATLKHEDGSTERKCVNPEEAESCKKNPKTCSFCNSSYLCNVEGMQDLLCFSCHGDHEKCSPKANPFNIEIDRCEGTDEKCFSSVHKEGNNTEEIYRGCLKMNAADPVKEKHCDNVSKEGGLCRICHTHLCNSVEAGFTGGDKMEKKPRKKTKQQKNTASSIQGISFFLLSLYIPFHITVSFGL